MRTSVILSVLLGSLATALPAPRQRRHHSCSTELLTDIDIIQSYWGEITPYADNAENYFGVADVSLPDGCQIEQVHLLERHGARFPTGSFDDGGNDARFGQKVMNWTSVNSTQKFTGPLSFLNTYRYELGLAYLVGRGASQSFDAGSVFWSRYGRILYNATVGQLHYNASYENGTARPKPVLRTTGQARIQNTQINWALGFFGPSYDPTPDPDFNASAGFNVVIIPEGGTENNTLASYDSCFNDVDDPTGILGDYDLEAYVALYLPDATARLQQYAPEGFQLTVNDTFAMQSICAYETNYLYSSDFCTLFTENEWAGFENAHDMWYFYDYSYGNPTGRAQGIGYLQELIARLTNVYITSSNSSVNSTITDNPEDFPLGQKFYADFSHDDILISVMTAMSLDYINDAPNVTAYPPDPNRRFILSHITPFAAKLVTEVVGCNAANPEPVQGQRTQYYPTQYGYDPATATNKFIRLRLNNGILPLSTIRGGQCGDRSDGMCSMENFLASQANAYELSNYNYACFANYTVNPNYAFNYDGTIS